MRNRLLFVAAAAFGTLLMTAAGPFQRVGVDRAGPIVSADTLETRPLRFLMVGLGQDMSRINDGIWHEDYAMIESGARGVADHARISTQEMTVIRAALAARFEAFVGLDGLVHDTAQQVAEAAAARDMAQILERHARMQQACVSCHAAYRSDVRQALY